MRELRVDKLTVAGVGIRDYEGVGRLEIMMEVVREGEKKETAVLLN